MSSIGDFVWIDENRNGLQDEGDDGLNGVSVNIFKNPDAVCDSGDEIFLAQTNTTFDPDSGKPGYYLFFALEGNFCIEFLLPDGYAFTNQDNGPDDQDSDADPLTGKTDNVFLGSEEDIRTVDAGLVTTALGNYVWHDLNGNGIQDEVDTGVNGVTVNLIENPNGDQSCDDGDENFNIQTTTTDFNPDNGQPGYYLFPDLAPGDYCVEFVPPSAYRFTLQNQGTTEPNDGDSDADPVSGRTANYSLDAGETNLTVDAGLVIPASIGDYVWKDENRNGIQDTGETGIENVLVELQDCSGNSVYDLDGGLVGPVSTSNIGAYLFDNLAPGQYTVKFFAPAGLAFTAPNVGEVHVDVFNDSDAETISGNMGISTCITLESGENNPDVDAGLVDLAESRLGDFVWEDTNRNGIQDSDELNLGIADISVELFTCGGSPALDINGDVIGPAITNASGRYYFDRLVAGAYMVRFDLNSAALNGYYLSPTTAGSDANIDSDADATGFSGCVTLGPSEENLSLDAGFYLPAALGDTVWLDVNGDGLQGNPVDEPGISNVLVELLDCGGNPVSDINGNPISAVTTDGAGNYGFDDLLPGSYTVRFTSPSGFGFTSPRQGTDDSSDSDAEFGFSDTRTTRCVTLGSGDYNPNIDAGLVELAECDLSVNATCAIIPELSSNFVCSDAKPIDTLQMIWQGEDNVTVVAHYGKIDDPVLTTVTSVNNGDVVSISGYTGASNDNEWEVFDEHGNLIGVSRFHISCSDSQMNGPEDCGLPQGNSKDDASGLLNSWALDGLIGSNGLALQCTLPEPGPGAEACTFETPAGPHCEGKVTAISLAYLGGDCTISNPQEGNAECLVAGTAGQPVRIRVSDGGSKVYLDTGMANVVLGDVVEATATAAGEDDFGSNTLLEIFSETGHLVQQVEFHTSCSKPLNLGDQFGAVSVVALGTTEGGTFSAGADISYEYTIVNNSIERFVDEASDSFGPLGSLSLDPLGGTATLSRTQFVMPGGSNTVSNTLSVTGQLDPSGLACNAQDTVTVTRTQPPAPQLACGEIKPITQLTMQWDGPDGVEVLTEGGQYFANVQNGNLITFDAAGLGNDVELNITGADLNGPSKFHVSCSDDFMDGPEDCGSYQGNGKSDDIGFINSWKLESMIGESGSFVCNLDNTGSVPPADDPGTGGGNVIELVTTEVKDKKLKLEIENLSQDDLFISRVQLYWPEEAEELKQMKFEGDFAKDVGITCGTPQCYTDLPTDHPFEDDANKRKIKDGDKEKLEIEFTIDIEKLDLVPEDFGVTIEFDDGTVFSFNVP